MIDLTELRKIRKNIETIYEKRDEAITESREIVKLSKQIIFSLHRNNMKRASQLIPQIKKKANALKKLGGPEFEGSVKIAMQEYVEAITFYELLKSKRLVKAKELGVAADHYLLGLFDLTGEIVRKAINFAIDGKNKQALDLKKFVEDLYDELLQFDFRNHELRKKFDSIKYNLKRLEDLAFELKIKNAR